MSPSPPRAREILRRIRRLEIRTRRLVENAFAGQYHSAFKGRGMDFDEVREYQPGDEIRSIDWNVTARTGHAHIKKFTEERELSVMLLVDVSASGDFGSGERSKRELAAEVAALLAYSATRNSDKTGLLLFSDRVELFLPPRKGLAHALRIIRDVLFFEPKGRRTSLRTALDALNRTVTRRAVVFLISDFQDTNFDKPLAITAKHHDVIALPISDPRERKLPPAGPVTFEDTETGRQITLDTSDRRVRLAFQEAARAHEERIRSLLYRLGIDSVPLDPGSDYLPALRAFFRTRVRRSQRE